MLKFANALPNLSLAQQLNDKVEEQLKESLTHLFEISEEDFDASLRPFKNKIQGLKASPFHYAINFEWLTALEQDNKQGIKQCAELLTLPKLNQPLDPYLFFSSGQIPDFFERLFQKQ